MRILTLVATIAILTYGCVESKEVRGCEQPNEIVGDDNGTALRKLFEEEN